MSEQPQQNLTLEQYISTLRNQIVLSYDSAKEVALRNFDDVSKKFGELYTKVTITSRAKTTSSRTKERQKAIVYIYK